LAVELLARCVEHGIPVLIIDTLRTKAEQEDNVRRGVSWTQHSKHLTGDAIDICPYDVYQLTGADKLQWDARHSVWRDLGRIGEELGLVWGGRWTVKDLGHFEYPTRKPPADTSPGARHTFNV
jgi:peptidoglycan L-alanyl-D-glutamate endopeptidase CwlK